MTKQINRARGWCFTLNNPEEADIEFVKAKLVDAEFVVVGHEVGEQGTPHLQGYVFFSKRLCFNKVKRLLPHGTHIEAAKGSPAQNHRYCSKDGNIVFTKGTCPRQGGRKDVADVRIELRAGKGMAEIVDDPRFNLQCVKLAETWLRHHAPKRSEPTRGLWIWGPTGSGKSRAAYTWARDKLGTEPYPAKETSKWWDGYVGQEVVVVDDVRTGWSRFEFMLRLVDRWPLSVATKGGFTEFNAKWVIFTSNYHPHDLWQDGVKLVDWAAFHRRIRIVQLGGDASMGTTPGGSGAGAAQPSDTLESVVASTGGASAWHSGAGETLAELPFGAGADALADVVEQIEW